jgi:hypothetical protein
MFRKLLFFIISALTSVVAANAQSSSYHPAPFDQMFTFAWDVNFPVSNNFVSKTSYDGFRFDYRKMIKSDLSVGLDITWNSYYQYYPTKTYQIPDGAVTTDLYSYIYTLPIAVNVHHYFHAGKMVIPYAGLAIGATYSEQRLYYNTYVSYDDNWGFLIRPEIGAIIKFHEQSGVGLLIGADYSYSTNSESAFKINGLQSFGLQLGIVFMK